MYLSLVMVFHAKFDKVSVSVSRFNWFGAQKAKSCVRKSSWTCSVLASERTLRDAKFECGAVVEMQ